MAGKRQYKQIEDALERVRTAPDGLEQLDAVRDLRERTEAKEREVVAAARRQGFSWTQIGEVYGMTKQGAQQRFRSDETERKPRSRAAKPSRDRTGDKS